ncbi:hypothetical protein ACROYT_G042744 [Oculina patagonica]
MRNGSALDSLALNKVPKPKQITSSLHQNFSSSNTAKQKNTDLYLKSDGTPSVIQSSEGLYVLQNGYGVDSSGGTPVVLRKDRLVQEIENSLAEIEDHYSNTSKLEEERTAVEMERNSLLKDIEETITEIQNHVLNSSELALEKGALQEECDGLRGQVDHLKVMLDNSDDVENGDENDGLYPLSKKLKQQNLALKAEIEKLTLENEKLRGKEQNADVPSDLMSRELELLHDENANLQKLLQMAEESEDNMAKELTSSHSKLTEMQKLNESLKKEMKQLKSLKEQLELDREDLEEEVDSLQKRLNGSGDQNGNVLMLKESKEDLAKAQKKCSLVEKENSALNKKIEQLEKEIQQVKDQKETESEPSATPKAAQNVQQLKSALEKLNKETSSLHDSLENAEKEIASLKDDLEKERQEKETLKLSVSEKGKKQKNKKEKETETGNDNEDRGNEVEVFKKEIYNLKSECQCLSETVAKTANEKRKMAKEIETLTEEKTKLESKVVELEKIIQELNQIKSEKEELEGTYSNLKTLHDELAQKLEVANKNNNEKDEILQRTLTEKSSVEKLCKDHEATIEKIKKDLAVSKQDVMSKSDEVKLLKKNLEEQRKELSTVSEREQKEKQRLQEEMQKMSERVKSSEKELNTALQAQTSKGSELQNLRITVDEMRKELILTKQNLRDVEEARKAAVEKTQIAEKAMEDLEKSNAVFNDMAMEKSLELSRTKRTLEKKVDKLTKENSEMRKKFGYEPLTSTRSQTPPRLSPVAVHMQKIPSLDVNLEHLSKPSQRQRNNGIQRRSRDPSPSSRVIAMNGPTSDKRLRRSSIDSDSSVDRQQRESDYVKPQHNEVLNSAPSEYRVVASEVASAPPKQQFTSSVVHVMTSSGRDLNSTTAKDESEYDRASYNQWRDDEKNREERRLEEQKPEERERPPDNTVKQDNSESAFQVVGYRKGGKVLHEHWV